MRSICPDKSTSPSRDVEAVAARLTGVLTFFVRVSGGRGTEHDFYRLATIAQESDFGVRGSTARNSLDYAGCSAARDDARRLEPAFRQKIPIFLLSSIPTARADQHQNVGFFGITGLIRAADNVLHHQQFSVSGHCPAAVAEDLPTAVAIPVMQDVLHDVQVTSLRDGREEVSPDEVTTGGDRPVQLRPSGRDDVIQVEEDAASILIASQYRCNQYTLASAYIDNGPGGREIIGGYDRLRGPGGILRLEFIKDLSRFRMLLEPIEGILPIQMFKGGFSGCDAMDQRSPGTPHPLFARRFREGSNRTRNSGTQEFRRRCEPETKVLFLGEHALASESTQEAIQGIGMSLCRGG